jgi:hypothetical protein
MGCNLPAPIRRFEARFSLVPVKWHRAAPKATSPTTLSMLPKRGPGPGLRRCACMGRPSRGAIFKLARPGGLHVLALRLAGRCVAGGWQVTGTRPAVPGFLIWNGATTADPRSSDERARAPAGRDYESLPVHRRKL